MHNHNNRQSLSLFLYFCILFITCSCFWSLWTLILLIIPLGYCFSVRNGLLIKLLLVLVTIVCGIITSILIKEYDVFNHLSGWLEQLCHIKIRDKITNFIDKGYDQQTGDFIKMILFNIKTKDIYPFYQKMINLSIVYLVVVSGFHIAILKKVVHWMLKKHKYVSYSVNLVIILFYSYLLNFATSIIRVLFMHLITMFSFRKRLPNMDRVCLAGIITLLICPYSCQSYGFCMSYFCTIVIVYIVSLNIDNKIIQQLIINSCCVLITFPYVINMNGQISVFAVINSLIFSYIYAIVFAYFLITFWIIWIGAWQAIIVKVIIEITNSFYLFNVTPSVAKFNEWSCCLFQIGTSAVIYQLRLFWK